MFNSINSNHTFQLILLLLFIANDQNKCWSQMIDHNQIDASKELHLIGRMKSKLQEQLEQFDWTFHKTNHFSISHTEMKAIIEFLFQTVVNSIATHPLDVIQLIICDGSTFMHRLKFMSSAFSLYLVPPSIPVSFISALINANLGCEICKMQWIAVFCV